MRAASVLFVTTSRCPKWVICVPAAFLGSGRRFSGGLSRIEPRFSVIRQRHGWHSTNRRQHDRSETQCRCRRLEGRAIGGNYSGVVHQGPRTSRWFSPNKCALPPPRSGVGALLHVLAPELPHVIHVGVWPQWIHNRFNEPSAVSPCTRLVLRHAWLNL